MITEDLIREILTKKEAKDLLNLNKKYFVAATPFMLREGNEPIDSYFQNMKNIINGEEGKFPSNLIKDLKNTLRCWELYCKVSSDKRACLVHWSVNREEQRELHNSYKRTDSPPRQDNKAYINKGNGRGYLRDVRYPSKKRKTAWKRFYKLFPMLAPKEES